MQQIKCFFSILLVGWLNTTAFADQETIKGPSVASPGDEIILMVPSDVAKDAFVVVLLDGQTKPEIPFRYEHPLLIVSDAKQGTYKFIISHGDGHLEKDVSVGALRRSNAESISASEPEFIARPANTTLVGAGATAVQGFIDEVRRVGGEESLSENCKDLSAALGEVFKSDGFEDNPFRTVTTALNGALDQIVGDGAGQTLRAKAFKLVSDRAGKDANAATMTKFVKSFQTDLQSHVNVSLPTANGDDSEEDDSEDSRETADDRSEEETIAAALADFPKDYDEEFAEAIKDRMFAFRVNDFDPDFQTNCQELAERISRILRKPIDDVQEFRKLVSDEVKTVIDGVSGTEDAESKKRWKDFYFEHAVLLFVLEVEKSKRENDPRRGKYFDRFNVEGHQYQPIVLSPETFERQMAKQRKAFEIFVAALNKAIERDQVENANAQNRGNGSSSSTNQGAYGSAAGGYYSGTVLGRMHQRKMARMYYHHKQRMARIRGY